MITEKSDGLYFKDYEDSVHHKCAELYKGLNYIITRNKRDFKNSIIEVLSPEELYFDSTIQTEIPSRKLIIFPFRASERKNTLLFGFVILNLWLTNSYISFQT